MKQRVPEWHEFRRNHIGSSDASICLGDYRYKTPYQLYLEKIGLGEPEPISAPMQRGLDLEEEARMQFERVTGHAVFPTVRTHKDIEWMSASLDGLSIDGDIAVELKCPSNPLYHEMAMDGVLPEHHMPQLQHQMEVLGLQDIYFFSYTVTSYGIIIVKRSQNFIDDIKHKEKAFWECVTSKKPPSLTEKDYVFCDSNEWKELTDEWKQLCDLDDKKERVRKRLLEISGKRNAKGNGITLTKVFSKGKVAYDHIPVLQNLDLEPYRNPPSESFRITVN